MDHFTNESLSMLKTFLGLKSRHTPLADAAPDAGLLRPRAAAVTIVLALALAATVSTALLVSGVDRRLTEDALQRRADEIGRSVDLKLSAYHAAVLTVAEAYSLREEFDLVRIERLARRVGDVFGGWFVITSGDEQVFQLMNTLTAEGTLFGPITRTDRPELMRAEVESLHLSRSVTSDAFFGRLASELIVSTVTAITLPDDTAATLGFVTTPERHHRVADGRRAGGRRVRRHRRRLAPGHCAFARQRGFPAG
jgi:hypothetical protein